jgi:hypothetical protein
MKSDIKKINHGKNALDSLWYYILTALIFMILGLTAPLMGLSVYAVGSSDYDQGKEIDDKDLQTKGSGEMFAGMVIQDSAIPLFLFAFGILLTGLLRTKIKTSEIECSKCHSSNLKSYTFCQHCGRDLKRRGSNECPECQKPILTNQRFCSYCGTEIEWSKDGKKEISKDETIKEEDE